MNEIGAAFATIFRDSIWVCLFAPLIGRQTEVEESDRSCLCLGLGSQTAPDAGSEGPWELS